MPAKQQPKRHRQPGVESKMTPRSANGGEIVSG